MSSVVNIRLKNWKKQSIMKKLRLSRKNEQFRVLLTWFTTQFSRKETKKLTLKVSRLFMRLSSKNTQEIFLKRRRKTLRLLKNLIANLNIWRSQLELSVL